MSAFPVDHLSASSLTTFIRCPRAWQEQYVFEKKGPLNGSIVVGKLTHYLLAQALMGESMSIDDAWMECVVVPKVPIIWDNKITENAAPDIALRHAYNYYETIGKFLDPIATEQEIALEIKGVDIPVIGFVDIECADRIIDVKTTGYFNRKVTLNPEWKLQGNIYQIYKRVPAEFHVLTRSKTDPVVVPTSPSDQLYIPVPPVEQTEEYVRKVYAVMKFYVQEFGEEPFPGNRIHPWAGRYCKVVECCQK